MIAPMYYYALLGIPRKASEADVRAAYKREERIWRKLAAASLEGSIKNEAGKRLALIAEAFNVLSNAQQRAVYDRQPVFAPVESPSSFVPVEMASRNWIEQAEGYLAVADYQAAARAAREATANLGNSAQSWYVLSRANAGLRHLDEAVYEARRAIELAPNNSMYHFNLGAIYEELGRGSEAISMYGQASQLEPAEPLYQLAIGGVLLQNDQPAKAMPIIEHIYSTSPNDEAACYYYAQALIAMAEDVPKDKSPEGYAVTSVKEILEMRGYLSRAAGIKLLDQETQKTIGDIEAYLRRMEGKTFHVPTAAILAGSFLASLSDGGCVGTLIACFAVGAFYGAPLLALLWGFSLLASGSIMYGLLFLLCSAGLFYLWFRAVWVPRWKVNARKRNHRIRYLS